MKAVRIGFGTAAIGRPQYINLKTKNKPFPGKKAFLDEGIEMLKYAYSQGIRYFDTAPGYGIAEEMMNTWISQHNINDITIASKWGYEYTANFNPNAQSHELKNLSIDQLSKQWPQTLAQLPQIKNYQIHSATIASGVLNDKAVLDKLRALKNEYHINIGLTASGENQVEVVQKAMEVDEHLFNVFQLSFNILEQSVLDITQFLRVQKKYIVCKEALANGRLIFWNKFPEFTELGKVLNKLAKKYDVGVDAIALAFASQSLPCQIILSGAATKEHLSANLKANDLVLNTVELDELRSFSQSPKQYWAERKELKWN